MSIRLRLTLLYSIILALTLMLFSAMLYAAQARYTLNIVRQDLSKVAHPIARMLERADRALIEGPQSFPPGNFQNDQARQLMQPFMRNVRVQDTVRLLDPSGVPFDLAINEDTADLPLSLKGLVRLRRGLVWMEIAQSEEGRMLIYNQPALVNGQLVGIVQISRSLKDRDRSLRSLRVALLAGSLITTLVAFGIGWGLAGVTLRPIHRITQTAREIGQAQDFSSRVEHKGPNDELGRLARTFNSMLAHLEDAYQQITHALHVQRDFVADVSHELRTPLTTIRGNLALLQRDPPLPTAEQEDILSDLIAESERLSRLVSDLLTLARADTGRSKLTAARVDVQSLIDEVCRQARLLAPNREVTCESVDDLTVMANEDALKQVMLILLDNAAKHAHGPIRVTLRDGFPSTSAEAQSSNFGDDLNHFVAIRVKDHGPGMSPELQARIFDRFYRGDVSRSTPGFGLGLSIAQALIQAQQGHIEVKSAIGEGSTFTVYVPKADEA
jgi:signal transduction histidine kinase